MSKPLFRCLGAFGLSVLIVSCQSPKNEKKSSGKKINEVSFLEGTVVKPTVLDQVISLSGTLIPYDETVLMPEVSGRVVELNLPEGKFVKKGTLLVKLFDDDLQAQLQKSKAQLEIEGQLQKRQSELIRVNGISQSDYDQTLLQVSSIKADIEVLDAEIRKTEILAPFDGMIGLRNISLGAEVTPSTPLVTIRDVKRLKLDFSASGEYSNELVPGKKVTFTVQGNDKVYDAVIMANEEGIDLSTRNIRARAIVLGNVASLKPGAFVNVELKLEEIKNALMVPTQAIIPNELDKQVIVSKNKKAVFVNVKTGVRRVSDIEVTSGLQPGDTVVTTGILFIKPGYRLKFSTINN